MAFSLIGPDTLAIIWLNEEYAAKLDHEQLGYKIDDIFWNVLFINSRNIYWAPILHQVLHTKQWKLAQPYAVLRIKEWDAGTKQHQEEGVSLWGGDQEAC